MAYHVYKFNRNEIDDAQKFCDEHQIKFFPYYASINDYPRHVSYISGKMTDTELEKINDGLCLSYFVEAVKKQRPQDYVCPQTNILTIDENLNVLICCGPKDENYGSIFGFNSAAEIAAARFGKVSPSCGECRQYGLDFIGHNMVMFHPHQNAIIDKPHSGKKNVGLKTQNVFISRQFATGFWQKTAIRGRRVLQVLRGWRRRLLYRKDRQGDKRVVTVLGCIKIGCRKSKRGQ